LAHDGVKHDEHDPCEKKDSKNEIMKKQIPIINRSRRVLTTVCLTAVVLALSSSAAKADSDDKIIAGESAIVAGGTMSTWARINGAGKVIWVGTTMPLSLVENQPPPGSGPAGAIAVLNYPPVVQQTTYFNHAEIHSNLHGHPANPRFADIHRYEAPHFDFHFYSIPVAQVLTIPFVPPSPLLPSVPAERLPVGYAQPEFSVLQMGRHAAQLSEFTATDIWQLSLPVGFLPDASYMHFIEPMITREFLLRRENFTLPVPMPAGLGRATQYPTECVALYDKDADAYHIVFKGFEPIE
jgi:hypothetical protein